MKEELTTPENDKDPDEASLGVPAEADSPEAEAPPTTDDPNLQPTEAEPEKSGKGEPIITIKGVFKSFKDHDVLRGVDMYVYKGENLVILGKSGSGKSVLIKCLVGLETPDAGEITIFEQDISTLKYDELNKMRVPHRVSVPERCLI